MDAILSFIVEWGPIVVVAMSLLASIAAALPFAPPWLKGLFNLLALNLDRLVKSAAEREREAQEKALRQAKSARPTSGHPPSA